ncbi:MAG: hypothetical protein NTW19_20445 [Planctomycetota bacterium]|nr:hypothetical protein [Planctomycetota bacterium]
MPRFSGRILATLLCFVFLAIVQPRAAHAQGATHRLYDDIAYFFDNSQGRDFAITLDIRDINHVVRGPSEVLVKVYDPAGNLLVREVIPDDGVNPNEPGGAPGAWDHDAFYYATLYGRGLRPAIPWSQWSEPTRLAAMPKRTFTYSVKASALKDGGKGVYRLVLVGGPNIYATISTSEPDMAYGVSGGPDWMHGHHDLFAKRFFCLPKGTESIEVGILELDCPANRRVTIKTLDGRVLVSADATRGMAEARYAPASAGEMDDMVVVVEVSPGANDYFLRVEALMPKEQRNWRGQPRSLAVLCPTEAAARAIHNGAIYHDGRVFWQGYQVRLYDWLKTLKPEDFTLPADLPTRPGFISVGSHQSPMQFLGKRGETYKDPKPGTADILMHSYPAHKNRSALNLALSEMLEGMLVVGPNDHVMHGRNLAYEMGTYSFFYHRPAWRILQQSDAPEPAKQAVREFMIQVGDRLAFARGIELVNGNSAASLVQGLRYCVEATGDPLQKELFETYWTRFSTGGFGDRAGIGPSGGIQEGYGYDYHYGGYVMRGWQAGIADLNEKKFSNALNNLRNLYSYVFCAPEMAAPWNSRTAAKLAGGVYGPDSEEFRWKALGGPDITGSVNDANEFFYARRQNYYMVAYAGRITPSWLGESFHGQIGFSGGILAQLLVPGASGPGGVPGAGLVLNSKVRSDYGGGMHPSQWRSFHLHSLVGTGADGSSIVTAYSEPERPRLDGNTLRVDAEVSQSCFHYFRTYTFGANDITATVRLRESDAEKVYGIYGGPHGLRGIVAEAYEMIPYVVTRVSPGARKPPVAITKLTRLDADGKEIGPITREPSPAAAFVVEQKGYGVRIDLDKTRPIMLGNNETVLIQIVARPKAAGNAEGEPAAGGEAEAPDAAPAEKEAAEAEPTEGGGEAAAANGRGVPAANVSLAYRMTPYLGEAPAGPVVKIDAEGAAANAVAAATQPAAPPKPDLVLAVLKPAASLDAVGSALANVKPMNAKTERDSLADIRFAVMGDQLAVDAVVHDEHPRREGTVWRGSEIEVFGANPKAPEKISQLFLAPSVGETPAGAFAKTAGSINFEKKIQVRSTPTEKGYRLQALIPLVLLGIDPASGEAMLEFQVTVPGELPTAAAAAAKPAKPVKGKPVAAKPTARYGTVFGSRFAYENSSRYGRFTLKPE